MDEDMDFDAGAPQPPVFEQQPLQYAADVPDDGRKMLSVLLSDYSLQT